LYYRGWNTVISTSRIDAIQNNANHTIIIRRRWGYLQEVLETHHRAYKLADKYQQRTPKKNIQAIGGSPLFFIKQGKIMRLLLLVKFNRRASSRT